MDFEFDPAKRLSNLAKHDLDFLDADLVLGGPHLVGPAKTVAAEAREIAVGLLDDVPVAVIFTRRGSVIRVISMRRARNAERRRHQAVFGG